jgi:hypothetical protein
VDKQLAAIAVQFMQRMMVQGSDVPAFVAVSNALNAIARGELVVLPAERHEPQTYPRSPSELRVASDEGA